jgi:hypothetical protein
MVMIFVDEGDLRLFRTSELKRNSVVQRMYSQKEVRERSAVEGAVSRKLCRVRDLEIGCQLQEQELTYTQYKPRSVARGCLKA